MTTLLESQLPPKQLNMQVVPGSVMGLTVLLDAHSDKTSPGTVLDDFYGFTGGITGPEDAGLMVTKNFLIPPGKVGLRKQDIFQKRMYPFNSDNTG